MDPDSTDFSCLNWTLLIKRLLVVATRWFADEKCFGDEAMLPATGKSAEDLVFDAVSEFIKGNIEWRPKSVATANDELFFLLRRVVRNDFLDLIKMGRAYKRTDVVDPYPSGGADDGQPQPATIDEMPGPLGEEFDRLEEALIARRIAPLLEGNPDLRSFVGAVLRDGCIKREDIAASLGVPPDEVSKLQRRLRIELASWKRGIDNARRKK